MKYFTLLKATVEDFSNNKISLEKAEEVSLKLHEAEAIGYNMSMAEDRLWLKLTDLIQLYYN